MKNGKPKTGTDDLFLGDEAQRSRVPPVKAVTKAIPALAEVITLRDGRRVASLGKCIQDKDTAVLLVAMADQMLAPIFVVPCEFLKQQEDGSWRLEDPEPKLIIVPGGG